MDPLVPLPSLLNLSVSIDTNLIVRIIVILLCIILAAIFAAAETGISQANRFRVTARADAGNRRAKILQKIINKEDNFIINILILINVTHIVPSMMATFLFATIITNNDLASVLSTIIMTIIIFLFSETLPKYIANKNPDKTAEFLAIPLYLISFIVTPFALIFRLLVKLIKKIFKIDDSENQITEEDFQDTVNDNEELGTLDEDESNIINAAVDFGDYTVKEVLTPLNKMITYDVNKSSRREVISFARNVEFTRIPVYENDVNNIIGVLHIRKYLLSANANRNYFNFRSILTKPLFVNEFTKIDVMFEIFQNNRTHMAIVRNEDNQVIGLVTMEDVVEKLVGDIDEKNPPKLLFSKNSHQGGKNKW